MISRPLRNQGRKGWEKEKEKAVGTGPRKKQSRNKANERTIVKPSQKKVSQRTAAAAATMLACLLSACKAGESQLRRFTNFTGIAIFEGTRKK